MNLSEYFENVQGKGILATADISGEVNAAVYARPHFMDETTIAFIMAERLTHENLQSNPHACYLFLEEGPGYAGKRLYLTKTEENSNSELIKDLRRGHRHGEHGADSNGNRYLVYFRIDKVLSLTSSQTE
ncbi:MAG TPA: pyridoxamine 5'-phosphate oxidase family protein [Deltaproteobacteria bacterium]|nr:pyridoxamine 5'-phosphate oxidase family protein [Deltaproteobacteria bacterium]